MKKPSLLLINPWIYDFKAYDFWMKPLGLLYIARILDDEGYELHFIDCLDRHHPRIPPGFPMRSASYGRGSYYCEEVPKPPLYRQIPRRYKRYGIPIDAFRESLNAIPSPDAILITSSMTYWYPGVLKAVELAKERFPEIPVLLGGTYCRLCPDHARENSRADIIFSSAEVDSLLEILGRITGNKPRHQFCDFKSYPAPYLEMLHNPLYMPILTSTGCPFSCTYCATASLFPHFSQKDPLRLADEIESLLRVVETEDVAFCDDALLVDFESHLEILLGEIQRRGLSLRFHTPNAIHARFVSPSAARMLKRAGFHTIRLGLEFSGAAMQDSTGGKVTDSLMEAAIAHLQAAGFSPEQIGVYILTGTPGLHFDDIRKALVAVHRWKALCTLAQYSPIPHTAMGDSFYENDPHRSSDPLYHNNTYHAYRSTVLPFEEYRALKHLSLELNRALRGGKA